MAGIFETGFYDVDMQLGVHVPARLRRKLFDLDGRCEQHRADARRFYQAPRSGSAQPKQLIGPKLAASTWEEQNRQILNALKMERIVTVITIGLIQIVAALNILITLVMMVMEKHRDIAILMSMGARATQIRNIFVFEGALIGAVGHRHRPGRRLHAVLFRRSLSSWIPLDEQVYSLPYVPFNPQAFDGLWIAGAAMAVSLIATLYPARNATRIAPVEALRYE